MAIQQLMIAAGVAAPPAAVTWNPADKGTGITLSGGNLIASLASTGGAWTTVRATTYRNSGKYYFEAVFSGTTPYVMVGVADSANNLFDFIGGGGSGGGSAGYYDITGQKFKNNSGAAYGATYTSGDVLGVAYDATGGTIEFFKNNVSQGVAYTSFTGSKAPAVSFFGGAPATVASATGRFKTADFTYTPPSGFSAWE